MAENNRVITEAQYTQLVQDISTDDRVAFYLHLHEYTGSQSALTMGQISSGSGVTGGIAWAVNLQIQKIKPDIYPPGGVSTFSREIAANDLGLIKKQPDGTYLVPTEMQMLIGARSRWSVYGLAEWFPGNGFIALEFAKNGDWAEAKSYLGQWKAFLPIIGNGAMEVVGETFGSRSNYSKDIQEFLDQNPGATKSSVNVENKEIIKIIDKNGKTLGIFPQAKAILPPQLMHNDDLLSERLAELSIGKASTILATVGTPDEGYTAGAQALKNSANRAALMKQWREETAGLSGTLQVLVDGEGERVTVVGENGSVTMGMVRSGNGNTDYVFSKINSAGSESGTIIQNFDTDKDGQFNATGQITKDSRGNLYLDIQGTDALVAVLDGAIRVTVGQETSTIDLSGEGAREVGLDSVGGLKRRIDFAEDGTATFSVGGSRIFDFQAKEGKLSATATVTTVTQDRDGVVANYTYSQTGFTSGLTSSGASTLSRVDQNGKWVIGTMTLDGKTYAGGDLVAFIANTANVANFADTSSGKSASIAQINNAYANALYENASSIDGAKSAASLAQLLVDRLRSGLSVKWFMAQLDPGILRALTLSSTVTASLSQVQNAIAQARINALRDGPSIINAYVLGYGNSYPRPLPLVLDIDDSGLELTSVDKSSVMFDTEANGQRRSVGWVGRRNGILVLDTNRNGLIDSATEWFGQKFSISGAPPANQNGFQALGTLTIAGATVFSRDTALINAATGKSYFDEVQIWIDANQDGKTDSGELRTLTGMGVASIDLIATTTNKEVNGGVIASQAGYTTSDGKRHTIHDVGLSTSIPTQARSSSPISAAAVAFADYTTKGFAALATGQAQAITSAIGGMSTGFLAAIATLNGKINEISDRSSAMFGSSEYFEDKKRRQWAMEAGQAAADYLKKVLYYTDSPGQIGNRRASSAPGDMYSLLNRINAVRDGQINAAQLIAQATQSQTIAETSANIANVTQTDDARKSARTAGLTAVRDWELAIDSYLKVRNQLELMTEQLSAVQRELNSLIPVNLESTDNLPGGYTLFTIGDVVLVQAALQAYSSALEPLAQLKITGDRLLAAIAQSRGYAQVYVARQNNSITAGAGYNLIIAADSGAQTMVLGSGLDNILITPPTSSTLPKKEITIIGFKVGKGGDQLQFNGSYDGGVRFIEDGAGGTVIDWAGNLIRLVGVDYRTIDLYSNISGVGYASPPVGGSLRLDGQPLEDGLIHINELSSTPWSISRGQPNTLIAAQSGAILEGGAGNDRFVIETTGVKVNMRNYAITDDQYGTDTISYENLTLGINQWQRKVRDKDPETALSFYRYVGEDSLGTEFDHIRTYVGSRYNDTLTGNQYANTLDGGFGNDILIGGGGNDTYVFKRGFGVDTIVESDPTPGNIDVISFGSDISQDQLWFKHVGNNLEVGILGTDDIAVVRDWYSGSANQVEQFRLSNGKVLTNNDVDKLVQAMAVFSPPPSGQSSLPADYQAVLNPIIAASWK